MRKYVHRRQGKKRQKNKRGIKKKKWKQQRCRRNHTWNEMSKLKFRNLLRMRGQTFTRIFYCNYYFGSPRSNFYFRLITRVSLSRKKRNTVSPKNSAGAQTNSESLKNKCDEYVRKHRPSFRPSSREIFVFAAKCCRHRHCLCTHVQLFSTEQ